MRLQLVTHSFEPPPAAALLDGAPALLLVLCEALRRAALRSLRVTVCCARRRYCSIISAWACSRSSRCSRPSRIVSVHDIDAKEGWTRCWEEGELLSELDAPRAARAAWSLALHFACTTSSRTANLMVNCTHSLLHRPTSGFSAISLALRSLTRSFAALSSPSRPLGALPKLQHATLYSYLRMMPAKSPLCSSTAA